MNMTIDDMIERVQGADIKGLARAISLVENEAEGHEELLLNIYPNESVPIIGVTGAPGAGKSTLVDGLIREMTLAGDMVGVVCIDPSSPFNMGSVLGDRIRMQQWYNHPQVYIRSLASRGSLGGLTASIVEITQLMKSFPFDSIIVETVGIGQSEIEIAGLADTTVVVFVPEAGDEVQTMKAGLMEIADIFVVNKSDRPGADLFVNNLQAILKLSANDAKRNLPVIKTIASSHTGLKQLYQAITSHEENSDNEEMKTWLMAERAYRLIQKKKLKGINRKDLAEAIEKEEQFNLFRFVNQYV
jgi:LAO/AO transport system kinase